MSSLTAEEADCAVCGGVASRVPMSSSNEMEPPDFDTRPGEMLRSTLWYWVMDCPHCGYAAPDIREADIRAIPIVRDPEYQRRRADPAIHKDVRRFACYAFLLERLGQLADAGWAWLHAAWMSDDSKHEEGVRHCRSEAIRLWKLGKAAGQDFMEDQVQEFALVTDVLRRIGDFEAAREACLEALTFDRIPAHIEDMLRRQIALIQQKDTAAHSLAEVKRPSRGQRVTLN